MKTIDDLIKELPPGLRDEVEDFIEFLIERRFKKNRGKPTFGWAGAIKRACPNAGHEKRHAGSNPGTYFVNLNAYSWQMENKTFSIA